MSNYWLSTNTLNATLQVYEVANSVSENVDVKKGFTASAQLMVPWANREQAVTDILINRVLYPRFPLAGARATTASIKPFESLSILDGFLAEPEYAIITVNYNQADDANSDNPDDIQYFSESLEPSAEFQTLDYRKFRWGSSTGQKLTQDQAPGRLIIGCDYIQTRYGLPSLPAAILQPGAVNDAPVTAALLGVTFDTETLLYQNSQPQRNISLTGSNFWTMASRFSYRPDGWNKFWNEGKTGGAGWDQIYAQDAGGAWAVYKNFPPRDFSADGILI